MEVLGSGGVTVWNKTGKARYTQGAVPDWNAGTEGTAHGAEKQPIHPK
jgi:hypothetical protein